IGFAQPLGTILFADSEALLFRALSVVPACRYALLPIALLPLPIVPVATGAGDGQGGQGLSAAGLARALGRKDQMLVLDGRHRVILAPKAAQKGDVAFAALA